MSGELMITQEGWVSRLARMLAGRALISMRGWSRPGKKETTSQRETGDSDEVTLQSERGGTSVSLRACGRLPGGHEPGFGVRTSFGDQSGEGASVGWQPHKPRFV